MSYARALAACDFASPAAPSSNITDPAAQAQAAATASADRQIALQKAHDKALEQQRAYVAGMDALQAAWANLPLSPYPPAGDTTGFPRSGDPTLVLDRSSISQAALAEPGRVTAGQLAQAQARAPKLSPLFWVGLALLGTGIYVARNR